MNSNKSFKEVRDSVLLSNTSAVNKGTVDKGLSNRWGRSLCNFNRLDPEFLRTLWNRGYSQRFLLDFLNSLFLLYPNEDFFDEDTACIGEMFFVRAELCEERAATVCKPHGRGHLHVIGTLLDGSQMLIVLHIHEQFTDKEHELLNNDKNLRCTNVYSIRKFENVIHIFLTHDYEIQFHNTVVRYRKPNMMISDKKANRFSLEAYVYLENFVYWEHRHLNAFETWIMYLRSRRIPIDWEALIDDNPIFRQVRRLEEEYLKKHMKNSH